MAEARSAELTSAVDDRHQNEPAARKMSVGRARISSMVETEIAMRSTIWKKSTVKLSTGLGRLGLGPSRETVSAPSRNGRQRSLKSGTSAPRVSKFLVMLTLDRGPRRQRLRKNRPQIQRECNDFNRRGRVGASLSRPVPLSAVDGLSIGAAGSASATTYKKRWPARSLTPRHHDRSFNASAYWAQRGSSGRTEADQERGSVDAIGRH